MYTTTDKTFQMLPPMPLPLTSGVSELNYRSDMSERNELQVFVIASWGIAQAKPWGHASLGNLDKKKIKKNNNNKKK